MPKSSLLENQSFATITANFAINTYTLTVNAANGSVTKDPDKAVYDYGEAVTLTAVGQAPV